jgi:hypothetical protein
MMNLENHHSEGNAWAKRNALYFEKLSGNRHTVPVAENHHNGCDPSGF